MFSESLRRALRLRASTSGRTILRRKAGEGRRGEDPKSDFGPKWIHAVDFAPSLNWFGLSATGENCQSRFLAISLDCP